LGHEHLIASIWSTSYQKEVLKEELQDGASKEAEDYFESTGGACNT
jgi:hypothetical protein